jgi:hypothetical protein
MQVRADFEGAGIIGHLDPVIRELALVDATHRPE